MLAHDAVARDQNGLVHDEEKLQIVSCSW